MKYGLGYIKFWLLLRADLLATDGYLTVYSEVGRSSE
jgi:hypothetical protein